MAGSYAAPPDKAGSEYAAIDAHYYNITEGGAWPVAGLLVLLDRQKQPVRAELHLYDDLPSHIQEGAVRQSRQILEGRYIGQELLPLRILVAEQMREAMDVRLPREKVAIAPAKGRNYRPLGIAAAMLALAVALTWGFFSLWGTMLPTTRSAEVTTGDQSANEVPATLPPSRNARSDIGIGQRIRIDPNYSLAIRSEAGADAGIEQGQMANGAEAVVVAGPVYTQGDSDTIVWWYVRLDDGSEGWAPANTSAVTLLLPIE